MAICKSSVLNVFSFKEVDFEVTASPTVSGSVIPSNYEFHADYTFRARTGNFLLPRNTPGMPMSRSRSQTLIHMEWMLGAEIQEALNAYCQKCIDQNKAFQEEQFINIAQNEAIKNFCSGWLVECVKFSYKH